MSTQCIIVNLSPQWEEYSDGKTLRPSRRPKYVHDDLESAQTEALRLHKKHAGPAGRFVIFQAVEQTTWRTPFEIAAATAAALEPIEIPVLPIAERAKKKRRKKP